MWGHFSKKNRTCPQGSKGAWGPIYRGPRVHKGPRGAPGVQWSKGPQGQRVPRVKGSTRVPRVKRSTGVQGSTRVPRVKGSTKVHRPLDPWTPRSLDPWSPCPGPGPAHGLSAACYVSYKLRSLQFRSVCVVLALPCCSSLLSAKLKTDNAQESNNYGCSDDRLASKRHLQVLRRPWNQ